MKNRSHESWLLFRRKARGAYMRYINPVIRCPYVLILPAVLICVTFSIIPTAIH